MNIPTIRTTKSAASALALGAALFVAGLPAANAITLNLASLPGAIVQFIGTGDTFSFEPQGGPGFVVTGVLDGFDDSVGLNGSIAGGFTIGAITTIGLAQSAPVTGSATFSIDDGTGGTLTATLVFQDILTQGFGGTIQTTGTGNLTNFVYTPGSTSISDLALLASFANGTQTVSFQFIPQKNLTTLTKDGNIAKTSYSSTIAAVPIPAAALLFGSALLGMVGVAGVNSRGVELLSHGSP